MQDVPVAETPSAAAPRVQKDKAPRDVPAAPAMNVLTGALGLLMASPRHKHLFLADLEWALLPPLALKQYRLFTKDNRPVAFATWAFVSAEVEERLKAGQTKLKPAEWTSGDRCWIVDVVAPHAPAATMVDALKRNVLQDHEVSTCV